MSIRTRVILAPFLCLPILFGTVAPVSGAPIYTALDLGVLPGSPNCVQSVAFDINDLGQVVGMSADKSFGNQYAFRTAPNAPINPANDALGAIVAKSAAYGINDAGNVVGYFHTADGRDHAFRTAPNAPINPATDDLGTVQNDRFSYADAINNIGQVVGYSFDGPDHAYRTAANANINPATDVFNTFADSRAFGINNSGQAVGGWYHYDQRGIWRAFRTEPNAKPDPITDDLGTLGGLTSFANGVNDLGQAAGYADTATTTHAFRTFPNAPIDPATDDLGTLGGIYSFRSYAWAINNSGEVVGWSADKDFKNQHGFVYTDGAMFDLNAVTANLPSGIYLSEARAINNKGQIAAEGFDAAGNSHAFLLTPVPEPVTFSLFLLFGVGLLPRRRAAPRGVMPGDTRTQPALQQAYPPRDLAA